jgi:hypothetical protein
MLRTSEHGMSFAKLHRCIVTSSVFHQPEGVFKVWIAMLALADKDGYTTPAVPALSSICGITMAQADDAIAILSAPDPYSRTKDYEGRRIEAKGDGWKILNYEKYRDMCGPKGADRAEYFRDYRAKKRAEAKAVNEAVKFNQS